jgi:hypothetical protein
MSRRVREEILGREVFIVVLQILNRIYLKGRFSRTSQFLFERPSKIPNDHIASKVFGANKDELQQPEAAEAVAALKALDEELADAANCKIRCVYQNNLS